MFKLFYLFFFIVVSKASAYYVPCEPSLAQNTAVLLKDVQKEYVDIELKIDALQNKYIKYQELQSQLNEQLVKNLNLREQKVKIMLEVVNRVKNINDINIIE